MNVIHWQITSCRLETTSEGPWLELRALGHRGNRIGRRVIIGDPFLTIRICPIEVADQVIRLWRDFLADKNGLVSALAEFSSVAEGPDFPQQAWGKRVVTLAAVYAGDVQEVKR